MDKFIYNRYYIVFDDKGYIVRDSEDIHHEIVYRGTHPNGSDAKYWVSEHNPDINIGDKIIWDSNFGYEIGIFLGWGNQYNTYLVNLTTGIILGEVSHSIDEIKLYSDELKDKLNKKYGYGKLE